MPRGSKHGKAKTKASRITVIPEVEVAGLQRPSPFVTLCLKTLDNPSVLPNVFMGMTQVSVIPARYVPIPYRKTPFQ